VKLYIIVALVVAGLAVAAVAANAEQTAPCDLSPASTVAQARVQATCVAASAVFKANAGTKGWHVRVPSDSCSHIEYIRLPLYNCVFRGAIGSRSCRGAAYVSGKSRDPAKLRTNVVSFRCRS
jgi:hypothetical protein